MNKQEKVIAELRQRIVLYENCNMPTSTTSLYHNERNRFRQRRNEDTAGSPGDKAKTQETGADGKKRRGPPVGHEGISHNRTGETTLRYELDSTRCPCGVTIILQKPISTIVTDFDESWKVRSACAIICKK